MGTPGKEKTIAGLFRLDPLLHVLIYSYSTKSKSILCVDAALLIPVKKRVNPAGLTPAIVPKSCLEGWPLAGNSGFRKLPAILKNDEWPTVSNCSHKQHGLC